MRNYSYLFEQFKNREVCLEDKQDTVVAEMENIAATNGLSIVFNKMGEEGGACVMPPSNQVTVTLTQGADDKWRVYKAR